MRGKSAWILAGLLMIPAAAGGQAPPLGIEFPVNVYQINGQRAPELAMDGAGNFVVTWSSASQDGSFYGAFARRYSSQGFPFGPEFQVNTYTTGDQYRPSVAVDGSGNFVVVWESSGDGAGSGVFGRRYDSAGNPIAGEFQVNTYTTDSQYISAVAMDSAGSFVVVWTSVGQDGSSYGIFGRRYDSAGNPIAGEFQVNTYTTGFQYGPAVAMDSAGSFVVVWTSVGQDGDLRGVFGQRYDSSGAPQGTEFQVNTYTFDNQRFPAVGIDASGNFVVVWTSYGQDGDISGVFGRRYDSAGTPLGGEFQVNTYTTSSQGRPSAAVNPSGDFVVTWTSVGQDDPASSGIFAQRFDSSGNRKGQEFQLNVFTTGDQTLPSVALDSRGQFVIAWTGYGNQDNSGAGIFARRGGFPDAQPMKVDERSSSGSSNVNGVLESGETVTVDPAWRNPSANSSPFFSLTGNAVSLTGPPGPAYTIVDSSADYGMVAIGATNNCFDATGNCFEVRITGARPTAHWDAALVETLSEAVVKTWTLHLGESFTDVPTSHLFYRFIENLFHNGVTGGCGLGAYCPGDGVSRAQMAVFLLKAFLGAFYAPPPATGTIFADVPLGSFAAAFIEDLYNRGITGGCGGGNYCPTSIVSRQQMAAFLLKTKYGSGFVPPACTGIFPDVPCPSTFADWIEQLFAEAITGGCGGGNYCPLNPNTRGQMAVFLVKTFGLLLYGP